MKRVERKILSDRLVSFAWASHIANTMLTWDFKLYPISFTVYLLGSLVVKYRALTNVITSQSFKTEQDPHTVMGLCMDLSLIANHRASSSGTACS